MAPSRNNGTETGELYVVGPGRPPIEHRFRPGNPGRPKGSRNKLGEHFIAALQQSFEENGEAAIQRVLQLDPVAYLKLIASVIPKDFIPSASEDFSDLSDEDLDRLLIEAASDLLETNRLRVEDEKARLTPSGIADRIL